MENFSETYTLAHTARCKLQLAADRPDRNLRFILGHAFTLDKLRLRLAEIEESSGDDEESLSDDDGVNPNQPTCGNAGHSHSNNSTVAADTPVSPQPRRVSFTNTARPDVAPQRQRSPPPQFGGGVGNGSESDSDSSEDGLYDDYEDEAELGLQRFGSAAAQPPRLIADDEDDEEVNEPRSPTDEELRLITGGDGDGQLADMYNHVSGCPCHGQKGQQAERIWELPQKPGHTGPRVAIVQVSP